MQYTIRWNSWWTKLAVRLHGLVVVSCLGLALLGQMPDESLGGWTACPPARYAVGRDGGGSRRRWRYRLGSGWEAPAGKGLDWRRSWRYLGLTWPAPVLRSAVLGMVWLANPHACPLWVVGLPWVRWLSAVVGLGVPGLARQPAWRLGQEVASWGERWTLRGALGLAVVAGAGFGFDDPGLRLGNASRLGEAVLGSWGLSGLLVVGGTAAAAAAAPPRVTVRRDEAGHCYRAEIQGDVTLAVADDDPFRLRLLVLFLRLLEGPEERRGSRATREGRRPLVRQQALARALGLVQPVLSRWEQYWVTADWRRLLSQRADEVLTRELQQTVIEAWAQRPGWGAERMHRELVEQGVAVTLSQVQQAAHESGWQVVRGELARRGEAPAAEGRLRGDAWLVGDLLAQTRLLLHKLQQGEGLTAHEEVAIAAVQERAQARGGEAPVPVKTGPWLQRVERVLFGSWEAAAAAATAGEEEEVRCPSCGSRDVGRKSRTPRQKTYTDEAGQEQTVAVCRYYCRNDQCPHRSFTHLPVGLVPFSRFRTEVHLLAVQMYGWGYSTYRRTGEALGVTSQTAYRWVSPWGHTLLPVAALFGVVKSSGVVGIDEKYVLVPKNDKSAGKMRRWMYVSFAVDVYTYDLLHLAISPHNTEASAQAFLLALGAKGYRPRVVVTDLRQDYGPVIAQVFPQAEHHECIFHALQNVQRTIKEIYGAGYAERHPEAKALKQRIYAIFDAKTKRTAHTRYAEVLALRDAYVSATPAVEALFAFLERHWPKLVNGIESDLIPPTNNTVELVIRRFDRHYQNFCGFERIASARLFLGVFEKLYRFTPFSQDAQPRLRGKSPLELAGYDVRHLPMATLAAGQSIIWPTEFAQVPNS